MKTSTALSFFALLILSEARPNFKAPKENGELTRQRIANWKPTDSVNPEELGELFEGDIAGIAGEARNGIIDEKYRWPNGVVPYVITPGDFTDDEIEVIMTSMQSYYDYTNGCIEWVPRTNENDYVRFKSSGGGCSSYVGRIGGAQTINYQAGGSCISRYGTVQHEQMHALGFYHEQSRWERDDWVKINWENIEPGYYGNFFKYSEEEVTGFGVDYDYDSAMHYSRTGFSINGEDTITPLDPTAEIGQRVELSAGDQEKVRRMYTDICAKKGIKF